MLLVLCFIYLTSDWAKILMEMSWTIYLETVSYMSAQWRRYTSHTGGNWISVCTLRIHGLTWVELLMRGQNAMLLSIYKFVNVGTGNGIFLLWVCMKLHDVNDICVILQLMRKYSFWNTFLEPLYWMALPFWLYSLLQVQPQK